MGLLNWISPKVPEIRAEVVIPEKVPQQNIRMFAGAHPTKNSQWQITLEPAHKAILRDMRALRAHSRDLCQNNAYARRYCQLVSTNVVGSEGMTLESCITGNGGKAKSDWNEIIEDQFNQWADAVTTDGRINWVQFQNHVAETVAADGEVFIHLLRGFPNAHGFAMELIDADSIDWAYSAPADSFGNRTIMGIEFDRWMRPINYWCWLASGSDLSAHPTDWEVAPRRVRVPASEILHVYSEDRIRGYRGIPWATPVLNQFSMLGRLLNAELDSAVEDAKRVAVITGPAPVMDEDGEQRYYETHPEETASLLQTDFADEDSSTQIWGLDDGQQVSFAPGNHPSPHLAGLVKTILEGLASGLGCAYHEISGDVSSANYSASRVALLDSRARWEQLQNWYKRQVCEPVFKAWLEMAVLTGAVNLPVTDWHKLCAPKFWPRSFSWIDPEKEVMASILAVRSGLSTYQDELGSMGVNWRRRFKQRAEEQAYQRELNLNLELDTAKAGSQAPSDPGNPKDGSVAESTGGSVLPAGGPNGK